MTIITKETAEKRLRAKESWPFWDGETGYKVPIHEAKFYGFYDAGGLTNHSGYDTLEEALKDIHKQLDDAYSDTTLLSTRPEELGMFLVTVLTGRQFIDRLYEVTGYNEELFNDYGTWTVGSNS